MLQCLPFQKLHHDKTLVFEFVDVVDSANVRVVQRRCRTRLALKTFHRWMVLGKLLGKEFQADKATQPNVLGLIHNPHAAATQLFQNTVMGDGSSDHEKETAVRGSS